MLELDSREGVRSWAMRLAGGEDKVVISDVRFPEDVSGEDGSDGDDDEVEEEEEEESAEEEVVAKRGRRGKGKVGLKVTSKGKENGKLKRGAKAPSVPKTNSSSPTVDDILVKLNGSQVKGKADKEGEWGVDVSNGRHVLEVGLKGGVIWKVYVERRL